jgi:hypothetical protein
MQKHASTDMRGAVRFLASWDCVAGFCTATCKAAGKILVAVLMLVIALSGTGNVAATCEDVEAEVSCRDRLDPSTGHTSA